jgi:hypothetical protein
LLISDLLAVVCRLRNGNFTHGLRVPFHFSFVIFSAVLPPVLIPGHRLASQPQKPRWAVAKVGLPKIRTDIDMSAKAR